MPTNIPKRSAPKDKPKPKPKAEPKDRPKLGSGLAENAAQALESRGSKIDRIVANAAKGKKNDK